MMIHIWMKIPLLYVKMVPVYNLNLGSLGSSTSSVKEYFKTIFLEEQNSDVLFIEPFQLTLKFHSFIQSNGK